MHKASTLWDIGKDHIYVALLLFSTKRLFLRLELVTYKSQ
uniref:Uncharacterized protein n=1 Tax=Rhizophora mucronata TaxID=61149 RepID=A0A2P2NV25_RHIMU